MNRLTDVEFKAVKRWYASGVSLTIIANTILTARHLEESYFLEKEVREVAL